MLVGDGPHDRIPQQSYQTSRQYALHPALLVSALTYQIWRGCGKTACPASTCYSHRNTNSHHPLRPYSELSSRSIALALASTPDGEKWLCPNIDPESAQNKLSQIVRKTEPKIDPKSLTQQLCNTAAIRNFSSEGPILHNDADPYSKAYRLASAARLSKTSWSDVFDTLLGPIPTMPGRYWELMVLNSMHGNALPHLSIRQHLSINYARTCTEIMQWYDHQATTAACHRMLEDIASEEQNFVVDRPTRNGGSNISQKSTSLLLQADMFDALKDHQAGAAGAIRPDSQTFAAMWLFWLQLAFLRNWSGHARIHVRSVAGVALRLIRLLYSSRSAFGLDSVLITMPRISFHLPPEVCIQDYLTYSPSSEMYHLVDFPFVFKERQITEHFRTYCHMKMRKAFGQAEACNLSRNRVSRQFGLSNNAYLDRRLKIDLEHYLVVKVSRESVLADAFDQLWQRERRELFRPLRVRMGIEEGEIGHDLGGVQVEFFNLVCQEAFESDRSLFIIDPETQLAWLRPFSIEPLYRYELLGLLFGLALYNGITLPVSLPIAFYRKLLGYRCNFDDLKEGWPSLARNLEGLLNHDGDVEDLALDYNYTVTANGLILDVKLEDPWTSRSPNSPGQLSSYSFLSDGFRDGVSPDDPAFHMIQTTRADEDGMTLDLTWPGWTIKQLGEDTEPRPVTTENRKQYVKDYTDWILDWSVRPQFYAFAQGFYRSIDIKATRLLTPDLLRSLLEGQNYLDIEELQQATTYDGYTADSKQIKWFWQVVKSYPQEKQKLLLEFVTASKRVPIHGASTLVFRIEDMEADTGSLPGSSTCFGTLRLPKYESMEKLRTKLDIALEHSIGFGQA